MRDDEIIKGCKEGKAQFQKMLLQKYAGYLKAVIRRYCYDVDLSNDILQESWVQIFLNMQDYREEGKLKSWMTKLTISQCFRELRKKNIVSYFDAIPDKATQSPNAFDTLKYQDLMDVVLQLKSPEREVFSMFVIDDLSHKEIGQVLKIKESTSRVYLTNARKKLRECLEYSNSTYVR